MNASSVRRWVLVMGLAGIGNAHASTCVFENQSASSTQEGLVLTRYAVGLSGSALVANTGFAASDAATIAANIVALGDQLDVNRNGSFDITDATIISRKLAGYSDAAATAGIPSAELGSGGAAGVQSFLLSGCGNSTAWQIGGNATVANSFLGSTSAFDLTVGTGGSSVYFLQGNNDGLRVFRPTGAASPNMFGGILGNGFVLTQYEGAVIAGGGNTSANCQDPATGLSGRTCRNLVSQRYTTISGGQGNQAQGAGSVVAGGESNTAGNAAAVVGGGFANLASNVQATVSGGGSNRATGYQSTVGGGFDNQAAGNWATIPGGTHNTALLDAAFAAGVRAKATNAYTFVWGGEPSVDTNDMGAGTFTAYAPGGFYFWRGAVGAGGCTLPAGTVSWSCTSDRNTKSSIQPLDTVDILRKVFAMPVARWSYKGTEHVKNIGPMAQDFWHAFELGESDKSIASMNMSGVALAAIQGLNRILKAQVRQKDAEIVALRAELGGTAKAIALLQGELAAVKRRLGM